MKNQSGNGKYMKSLLQTKIAMLLLGLAMCLSLALGVVFAAPTGIWEQTAIIHIWAIRPRGMLPSIRTAF